MKNLLKKFSPFLFFLLFISNLNLFAQIIFVEDIIDVPDTAIVGTPLPLTGTVVPEDATFQNIIWSILDAGTTGATITDNTLNTDAEGTVIICAKIVESMMGDGFTKNFDIEVIDLVGTKDIEIANIKIYPNPTTDELKIENGELKINNVEIFDIYGRNLTPHTSYLLPLTSYLTPFASLDISHLQAGIYFVRISTEKGGVIKKVVKQ